MKGELRVGGKIGSATTGSRVRINDPQGKFGRKWTHDARFTIDEDNPTVRSETGYPMCLPRSNPAVTDDPLCPQVNRPKGADGNYQTIFTMDELPFDGSAPAGTNPLLTAPFEVGDYVSYNGNLVNDTDGSTFMAAWGVIGNVGIFTAPFSQPTYVAIDVMLLGVGGIPDPNLPQEAVVRTRIEGFTTDPSTPIDLWAVDVDPCTGETANRYYASITPDGITVPGRWRWRPNQDAPFLPPTRMLLAVSESGVLSNPTTGEPMQTPNGLAPGQYTAPNFEFIFPENLQVGNLPVPNNFQDFPFLAYGSGPYPTPAESLGRLGQLNPWPGAVAPVQPTCTGSGTAFSPIADAGIAQTVAPNTVVTLDAGNSRDTTKPTARQLFFNWTQIDTGGPQVNVDGTPDDPIRRFTAPALVNGAPVTLTFSVTVSNGLEESTAITTVTVKPGPTPVDTLALTLATFRIRRSVLTVNVTSTNPAAVLTLQGFGDLGPAVPPAPGSYEIKIVGVNPIPLSVTVTSSLGGRVTLPVTVIP
jgi:hypothetical protein